jgi:hypothetical protein
MTFDARAFLAQRLGLPPQQLEASGYARRPHGTESATYLHEGEIVGRVLVSGPGIDLSGPPRRLVIATRQPRGTRCTDIAPDDTVSW